MYIDHLEIYYSRELIRKLHGIKSAVLFKVRDALRKTISYSIEHYYIFSQSAIKDTSTFAHFRTTSEAYRTFKMIRNTANWFIGPDTLQSECYARLHAERSLNQMIDAIMM